MSANENVVEEQTQGQAENVSEVSADESQQLLDSKLGLLLDIGVGLTVELGCQKMKIKDILKLNKNSVVELDKSAGDPLDLKVNGHLVARGEVIVVNEKYGIKLTEVVSKSKIIQKL